MSYVLPKTFFKVAWYFTASELTALLRLPAKLKADKKNGKEQKRVVEYCAHLQTRRTRCSFREVAAYRDQGRA